MWDKGCASHIAQMLRQGSAERRFGRKLVSKGISSGGGASVRGRLLASDGPPLELLSLTAPYPQLEEVSGRR